MIGTLFLIDVFKSYKNGTSPASVITARCSKKSPFKCLYGDNGSVGFGYITTWSIDNNLDLYLNTGTGIYRVVDGKDCGIKC